jgi:hypothetical protein
MDFIEDKKDKRKSTGKNKVRIYKKKMALLLGHIAMDKRL